MGTGVGGGDLGGCDVRVGGLGLEVSGSKFSGYSSPATPILRVVNRVCLNSMVGSQGG